MKTITKIVYAALGSLAVFCFAGPPAAQAVVPPPDGNYPGGNTAEGQAALFSLTSGGFNTAVGYLSLRTNTEGNFNTGIGAGALLANTGDQNTAAGAGALLGNTTGRFNTAYGTFALFSNTEGFQNTAVGTHALSSNTTGGDNTAVGNYTLSSNTQGEINTAVGSLALSNNTSGRHNIALGANAGSNVTTASGVICIGVSGENVADSCYIDNIFGAPSPGGISVFVNFAGKLGTSTSSERFKEQIKPMDTASEALFSLKPVVFRYKKEIDPERKGQLGLVAEDVEKVNPDLIVRDKEGKPYSVRYDQVNAMLLNEFLKEHKTVQELKKEIAGLAAKLKEQNTKIQRVRDELQLRKPAPRVAQNR